MGINSASYTNVFESDLTFISVQRSYCIKERWVSLKKFMKQNIIWFLWNIILEKKGFSIFSQIMRLCLRDFTVTVTVTVSDFVFGNTNEIGQCNGDSGVT